MSEAFDRSRDDRLRFMHIAEFHHDRGRNYSIFAISLVTIGILIVGIGVLGLLPLVIAIIVGCSAILVAVFPYIEVLDHYEKSEDLGILKEDYFRMDPDGSDRDKIWKLIDANYQRGRKDA